VAKKSRKVKATEKMHFSMAFGLVEQPLTSQALLCFKIGGSCCSYYIRPYFNLSSHFQKRLALNTLVYDASEQK
jgi:hypothetical protein